MKPIITLLSAVVLSTSAISGQAAASTHVQDRYFTRYLSADGLPNNTIYSITRDRRGFVWMGTKEGLCRFDGNDFTLIRDEHLKDEITGHVLAVEASPDGRIWFTCENRIYYIEEPTMEINALDNNSRLLCHDIQADREGNVWFCSGTVLRYDRKSGKITRFPQEKIRSNEATVDDSGEIWFAVSGG